MTSSTYRALRATPPALRRPVSVAIRTGRGVIDDRLPGLAAEIAFWVLLSLPALLVSGLAVASLVAEGVIGPGWDEQIVARTTEVARLALTQPTIDQAVEPILRGLLEGGGAGVASFGFLAAAWTASRAVKTVLTTIAIVYGRAERRAGWQDRLLGFAVTLGALLVGTILAPLLIAGPNFGEVVQEMVDVDLGELVDVWRAGYWPTVVLLATVALAALYHLGVPGRSHWRFDIPGAVVATSVWLLGSGALRLYGAWILDGDSAYGPLAGPIVLLLWLWLTGFAVLFGGLLNAKIARTSPRHRRREAEISDDQREPGSDDEAAPVDGPASGTSKEKVVPSPTRLTTPK